MANTSTRLRNLRDHLDHAIATTNRQTDEHFIDDPMCREIQVALTTAADELDDLLDMTYWERQSQAADWMLADDATTVVPLAKLSEVLSRYAKTCRGYADTQKALLRWKRRAKYLAGQRADALNEVARLERLVSRIRNTANDYLDEASAEWNALDPVERERRGEERTWRLMAARTIAERMADLVDTSRAERHDG